MNIIFDFSYLFHKSYSVYSRMINPGGRELDNLIDQSGMAKKIMLDFTSVLRKVDSVSNVIVCADSNSFRSGLHSGYKADRTNNSEGFHKTLAKCLEALKDKGFIVSKVDGLEADDLIALWAKRLTNEESPTMIVSGDHDIHQCVSNYCVVYNNRSQNSKVFAREDILDSVLEGLDRINNEAKVEYVDPLAIAFEKMLIGDKSDNIPSGFPEGGVGPKTVAKIYRKCKDELLDEVRSDNQYVRTVLEWAIEECTSRPYNMNAIMVNMKLTKLHQDLMPATTVGEALDKMDKAAYTYRGGLRQADILTNSYFIPQ